MIEIYKKATQLPDEWDEVADDNLALHKTNLVLLEAVNPCQQEYVVFRDHEVYAILVKYILKLDIFCYSKLHLYLPITIVGIPCSVAESGYRFKRTESEIKDYLSNLRGAKLILNAAEDLEFLGFTKGYTLPNCVMEIKWSSFEEYLNNLRSHYRYRYKKAQDKASELTIQVLEEEFDSKLYSLYEQVYNKSEYKLEKLTADFFRETDATIAVFREKEEPIAFVQYVIRDGKLYFLFGGLDYSYNKKYDLYLNMLLYLIKAATENHCTFLSLGQTAEEVKCKLGAGLENKYLYIHHRNRTINWLAKKFGGLFSYRMPKLQLKVFK